MTWLIKREARNLGEHTIRVSPHVSADKECLWVDWQLFIPVADGDDGMEYTAISSAKPYDWTPDLDKAQPDASGYIKWDGCSEFDVPHSHTCGGPRAVQSLFDCILESVDLAAKELTSRHWERP